MSNTAIESKATIPCRDETSRVCESAALVCDVSLVLDQTICRLMTRPMPFSARRLGLLLGLICMTAFPASAERSLSSEPWANILTTYVARGPDGVNLVDYGALKANVEDRRKLDAYIRQFETADFGAMSRDEQFAAWSNLYNAVTVRYVVEKYPIGSIKPWYSAGPWKDIEVEADGKTLSLHAIEHDVLREQWSDDPRLHYAINCASYSCPDLRRTPWRAATLDEDLNEAARAYVNHPRGVRIDDSGIDVSSIYKWFREDFGGSEAAVIDHLLLYADTKLAEQITARRRIDDYDYDWSLNDTAG